MLLIHTLCNKLQFIDVIARLNLVVTAQLGGGGNTFRRCTKWPTRKCMDFLVTCAGQDRRRVCSYQCLVYTVCGPVLTSFGQSFHGEKHHHLRPKWCPYKTAFSRWQAASTSMCLLRERRVRGNCPIYNLGRTRSDFSVGSDCLNAVKAGPCRTQLSKYTESSAVGLPGASSWIVQFYEGVV